MKIQQETIFRCEHCNRAMFGKGAMSLHERMCKKNPKNRHQCFKYCKWLNKDINDKDGFRFFTCSNRECKLYDMDLYSYKLERDYNGKKRIEQSDMIRMPLQCEHYEIEDGHDEEWLRSTWGENYNQHT